MKEFSLFLKLMTLPLGGSLKITLLNKNLFYHSCKKVKAVAISFPEGIDNFFVFYYTKMDTFDFFGKKEVFS